MAKTWVLDSFAILALLNREPGGEQVAALLQQAKTGESRLLMTWVNVGEVAYIIERRWGRAHMHKALALLEATDLRIVPVERDLALLAAHIKALYPLAYADAFAAALAHQKKATLVTGDPEFQAVANELTLYWLPQQ